MCGIFAYSGSQTAAPMLMEGLRTLEYRGYDSAGIFLPAYGVLKAVGPIAELTKKLPAHIEGTSGIAHTRWATHGAPTEQNAHPHTDAQGRLWLVHNGIIENYRELKEMLHARGVRFKSDTDTEVLTALISSFHDGRDLRAAVQKALSQVVGTYGMVVLDKEHPHEMVVARLGSPIVIGISDHGHFVSSDPSALLLHTKHVVYLEDGEIAQVTASAYDVMTVRGEPRTRLPQTIEWDMESVQKQGYEHFMQKEIMEGPEVVRNTLRGRLVPERGAAKLGGLEDVGKRLESITKLTIVGCGSAYHAGSVGKQMLEEYTGLPVDIELGSEYRYRRNLAEKGSALLAVSQSGETADTLASIRHAKAHGILTLGLVNVVGSSVARETDAGVYNHAGPEVAVASTKAFLSQLTVFALLTLFIGRSRGMSAGKGKEIAAALLALPESIHHILDQADAIRRVAEKYAPFDNAMFIGRKTCVPVAYEGALKLKEVSYVHAEAYAGGELKHGSIALLDESFPVIALAPHNDVYQKMISNMEEVKARGAPVLAIATKGDNDIASIADDVIYIPDVHPLVQPIVATVPLHLLAYHIGVARGLNVDRPRNLAKSVTVE